MSKIFKLQIKLFNFYFILWYHKKKYYTIDYREIVAARLLMILKFLKLNGTLRNVPYCHVIFVINYNMSNIHISYKSAILCLQDKQFFSYIEFVKTSEKIRERGHNPQTSSLVTSLYTSIIYKGNFFSWKLVLG
jgi:hypothetical protein